MCIRDSRKTILKFLFHRYHLTNKLPKMVTIRLPHSKAKVKLTMHNAWDCIQSLLTDPRITDDDYNFLHDDPFAPPPIPTKISELHTGFAYYHAHKRYITKPNQVLLPIVMYIDGAVTGAMQNLPITALKVTLDIFNRLCRDYPHAWRILGNVSVVSKPKTAGAELFAATEHLDAEEPDLTDEEEYERWTRVCPQASPKIFIQCWIVCWNPTGMYRSKVSFGTSDTVAKRTRMLSLFPF